MNSKFDLAVIGSGSAAFAAAIHATTLGKSVVMVERGAFGGTCVNVGCVPSKALIAAAEAHQIAAEASARFPGLSTAAGPVDMSELVRSKQELVDTMRDKKYVAVAEAYGWQIREGEAVFAGAPEAPLLEVTCHEGARETVQADHYLIATGARAWVPPIPGLAGIGYLTSTSAMELTHVPKSLLILGGGYVALEQAQLFARLGSKVTLLARSRLASREEPEVSGTLQQVFTDEGIQVVRHALATRVTRDDVTGQVVVHAAVSGSDREFRGDEILVALGRRPVTEGLNLLAVGVETGDGGNVIVTDRLKSSNPRIWAAGDVTGHAEFVYVAARHGALAVDNAFGAADVAVDYSSLPRVTFSSPAIGAVGMTERQVLDAGIRCTCNVLPLENVPRAMVNRDTRGFIKLVANADTGEILGLTAVAKDAGELAALGVHIIGKTIAEVADAWAPYLTMAEGIRIAARAFTTDVAKISCCA